MTAKKRTRKLAVSKEDRLRALIGSFSIEGIKLTMEEALAILKKVELSSGTRNG